MNSDTPLFWHQGLFLQPQHFQLLERSLRSLTTPLLRHAQPHFWGIASSDIMTSALGTGIFQLDGGEFLFPDGTHIELPANAIIESRGFEEGWTEDGRALTVFLGVRRWSDSGDNVTVIDQPTEIAGVATRYVATTDGEEIRDLHAGGPPARVKRMKHVLKIFWESERERLGDWSLIPIARLERFGAEVRLCRDYIPPCLTLSGSPELLRLVREIRDQIEARCRQLEEHKTRRGVHTADFGSRDTIYLLALRSLNRYLPQLCHYIEAGAVHPWEVYGLLRQLAGELSSFSETFNARGERKDGTQALPPYDHLAIGRCFAAAQDLVSWLLDEITAGPEYVFPLLPEGGFFGADLKPQIFEGGNRFYLALRTTEDQRELLSSLQTAAKLSSREQVGLLVARALPGVPLEHLQTPPQELPRRSNTLYFRLDHHNYGWETVEKGRNIALYWDHAPEDLQAELMVVGR